MIRSHDFTPSLLALLGAAGLGAVALFMTLRTSELALPAAVDAEAAPITIENPPSLNLPPFASYAVIADRPLFNVGRIKDFKTPPPSAVSATPQLLPLSTYRLVGIVVSGQTQRALVARASGEIVTLKPGDTLDGRTVTKIGPRGVSLAADGKEEILAFPRAGRAHSANRAELPEGSAQSNR